MDHTHKKTDLQNATDGVKEGLTDLAISHATDAVTTMITGGTIPAPIKKNVLKAFGQLCTAMVEIPVAHLEGITAEKKAETVARVKIITKSGDQIATQMQADPEFARAAVQKYGQKILREQVNLNKICEVAAIEINQQTAEPEAMDDQAAEAPEINSDWLNSFENEASQKSSEEMQLLFGRILAGEIQRPSSFSIKTVRLLSQLDSEAASLFKVLCSLCLTVQVGDRVFDKRVATFGVSAAANSLNVYGLPFDALNRLNEHGLIIGEYNSFFGYGFCITDETLNASLPFTYQNQPWVLVQIGDQPIDKNIRLFGVALSSAGVELSKIVDIQPDEKYSEALLEHFRSLGAVMVTVGSPVIVGLA